MTAKDAKKISLKYYENLKPIKPPKNNFKNVLKLIENTANIGGQHTYFYDIKNFGHKLNEDDAVMTSYIINKLKKLEYTIEDQSKAISSKGKIYKISWE